MTLDHDVGDVLNAVIPLSSITPHPRNYNIHSEANLQTLEASDARFGQVRSIVVQAGAPGNYLLVAGHGYCAARQRRGKQYVKADIIPASWSPVQVEGYLIADNLTASTSIADEALLAQLLQEQQDNDYDLISLGTDADTLTDMLARLAHPPTLDELTEAFGDEIDPTDLWPTIRLKVPPEAKELLESLFDLLTGSNEGEKFARILQAVDTQAM